VTTLAGTIEVDDF
jgi:hypothetical protein